MILVFLIALVSCDIAWVSVRTNEDHEWEGGNSNLLFCAGDELTSDFECCEPDRKDIDFYGTGMEIAWIHESDFVNENKTFFLCNMEDTSWYLDADLFVGENWFETADDVCISSLGPSDCPDVVGDSCIMWEGSEITENSLVTVTPYPASNLDVFNVGSCPKYFDSDYPPDPHLCDHYLEEENIEKVAFFDGYCYVLNMYDFVASHGEESSGYSFYDSSTYCSDVLGGNLVSIHTDEEFQLVTDFQTYVGSNLRGFDGCLWLGASWFDETGWTWEDGTDFDYDRIVNDFDVDDSRAQDGNIHLITWGGYGGEWTTFPDWNTIGYQFRTLCKVYVSVYYEKQQQQLQNDFYMEGMLLLDEFEEEMRSEAEMLEQGLDEALGVKKKRYDIAKRSEEKYMQKRSEGGMIEVMDAVTNFQESVGRYREVYEEYSRRIEFLNYELFMLEQIRDLVGLERKEVVLEMIGYDDIYEDWVSEIDLEVVGVQKRRRRRRRRRRSV